VGPALTDISDALALQTRSGTGRQIPGMTLRKELRAII